MRIPPGRVRRITVLKDVLRGLFRVGVAGFDAPEQRSQTEARRDVGEFVAALAVGRAEKGSLLSGERVLNVLRSLDFLTHRGLGNLRHVRVRVRVIADFEKRVMGEFAGLYRKRFHPQPSQQ